MRLRKDDAPAVGADPVDIAGDVPQLVLAILQRARLVAQHERAEEDLVHCVAGEDQTDIALLATELVEALEAANDLDAAQPGRAGDVGPAPTVRFRPDLQHAAREHAV